MLIWESGLMWILYFVFFICFYFFSELRQKIQEYRMKMQMAATGPAGLCKFCVIPSNNLNMSLDGT